VDQVTVPVGNGPPDFSETISLQIAALPTTMDEGLQVTVTSETGGRVTVILEVVETPRLSKSPG